MSEKLRESLSAVVDDEADEFELRRVLDELAKDPGLKASWERYHMIGTVLRNEYAPNCSGLRERVWQELAMESDFERPAGEPEPAAIAESREARPRAAARWTSLAVAAGVAFVVVVGVGSLEFGAPAPETAEAGRSAGQVQEAVNQAVALKLEATPEDEERLDAYKIAHSQQRGMNQTGPGAFAKMVSYQRR